MCNSWVGGDLHMQASARMDKTLFRAISKMKIAIVTGSRADHGILQPVIDLLPDAHIIDLWGKTFADAFTTTNNHLLQFTPDIVVMLGDRFEIMGAAAAAHLIRVPIAHIGGGDVTEGSYDNAMRNCISCMASLHFPMSDDSYFWLSHAEFVDGEIHMVGNLAIDYIRGNRWKSVRPHFAPYQVVSYQPETIDGTNELPQLIARLPHKLTVFIMPNPDRGSKEIREQIANYCTSNPMAIWHEQLPHDEFLNLLFHADVFIGNSSAMFYEAPELGVKCEVIGKRQQGRVISEGDGHAAERIVKVLQEWKP